MGGSASSQSTNEGDIDNRSNRQSNYGLINVAGNLYFRSGRLWCKRRRRKKLQSIRITIQEQQVMDHVQVQPHATRIPVISSAPEAVRSPAIQPAVQPPLYPGLDIIKSPQEILGGKIRSQYS